VNLRVDFVFKHEASFKSLPRVDSLGSRQILMSLRTDLCRVPSALRRLDAPLDTARRRVRALDVGAGQLDL
jgi:protein N-terminal methyltransferase